MALKNWQQARERAKTEKPPGGGLNVGKHIARLVSAAVVKSEKDGADRVQWVFMSVRGDEAGECQYDWSNTTMPAGSDYTDEDAVTWLFQRFGLFVDVVDGLDVDEIEPKTLAASVKLIADACPRVQFRVVEKDGYTNVKALKVFPEEDQEGDADDLSLEEAQAKWAERSGKGKRGKGKPAPAAAATTKKPTKKAAPPADDDDGDDADAKPAKKGATKKATKKAPEPDPDEVDLEAGMKVALSVKGEDCTGKIVDIDDDADEVTVKLLDGKKKGQKVVVTNAEVEVLDD